MKCYEYNLQRWKLSKNHMLTNKKPMHDFAPRSNTEIHPKFGQTKQSHKIEDKITSEIKQKRQKGGKNKANHR